MSLEATLTDIITRLRQGRFANEQAVSQGIVLGVLQELGWDIYDTTQVWPEFQTGEGRAGFALCHPRSNPAEFIEATPPQRTPQPLPLLPSLRRQPDTTAQVFRRNIVGISCMKRLL